ncbi:hypothetical protein C482_02651 [Natrialba chahannaoensis JCM 10990]|uniref:Baseplate J-like protein n=1 Tax=Natrialba chahannaoensis JCM 10990 TaxID=1227492 RepID=M0B465_9EURY|nr:baseplate J/gp47 family protein [Natrialba chahannaoensis]ELZ05018.1 hypothetical protein C482_02651 [Natrialba chahannaoensis JCM 10990]
MREGPTIDDRDQEELFETLLDRADAYTDAWDPHSDDVGRTLLRIFSTFESDVRNRLNEVPEKHLLAFLDALDFDRRPPQAARTPLSFSVSTDLDRNVPIPGGTQAVADAGSGDTQLFELPQEGGFEATPARLTTVVGVDPTTDRIVDHSDVLEDESNTLFVGDNRQSHVLYLGHETVLTLAAGSSLSISIQLDAAATATSPTAEEFFDATSWEYYGEDETGTEGWHRLERAGDGLHLGEDAGVEALQEQLESDLSRREDAPTDDTAAERTFRLPGQTLECAVNECESRWIRCRLADETAVVSAALESVSLHAASNGEDGGMEPDMLLSNDVPLSAADGSIKPFGRIPQPPATFYVACEEAFTKPGGVVDLEFASVGSVATNGDSSGSNGGNSDGDAGGDGSSEGHDRTGDHNGNGSGVGDDASVGPDATDAGSETDGLMAGSTSSDALGGTEQSAAAGIGVLGGPPRLSWEYWNGDGWTRLDGVEDGTAALSSPGTVRFEVPEDIAPTTVSGHDNVWIRSRLVSGNYGQPSFDVTRDGSRTITDEPDPPVFGDVSVQYDRGSQPAETVFRYNNAAFSPDLSAQPDSIVPFVDVPDDQQTLYLGFDDVLENGPLSLFVTVEDTTYPRSFDPGIEWEYCDGVRRAGGTHAADGCSWSKLDVHDRTGGLTERGIVTLTVPDSTTAVELFGHERHWIRARVTKDKFETQSGSVSSDATVPFGADDGTKTGAATASAIEATAASGGDSSRAADAVDGTPAGVSSDRTSTPPVLDGLYPNTQWAYNTVTVEEELLGSSDGSHEQSFRCSHAPVIDIEVWVDELSTLSASERRRLAEERPDAVTTEYDARGEPTAFWVRWHAVDDFLDSTPADRHYVVNRTLGLISFGDGDHGAIPAAGQDNVRATYTTGGGSDGNIGAKTITDLKSSIALVESVSNPLPADGGADIESTDALVSRSTNSLKHRGKAVTASDYERVAAAEFPELARVTCDPSLEHTAGSSAAQVTVLIVPHTEREKPVPSLALKHRVRETLTERAPASLVAADDTGIVVRGPNYADLSVDVTLEATAVTSVSLLKETIQRRLEAFLHPLSGGNGDGWAFGTLPTVDQLSSVVANVDDVAAVLECRVLVETGADRRLLSEYSSRSLPRDTLVCSGSHQVSVTVGESDTGGAVAADSTSRSNSSTAVSTRDSRREF